MPFLLPDVEISQGGVVPTVRVLTNSTPFDVAVTDGLGNQLTGFDSSKPATAVLTSVPSAITSSVLLASNPSRRKFIIYNASTKILYIAFAATASTSAYSFQLPANAGYEAHLSDYTGVISGIWSAVNGAAKVTEITA
jgi:hypothetical protein